MAERVNLSAEGQEVMGTLVTLASQNKVDTFVRFDQLQLAHQDLADKLAPVLLELAYQGYLKMSGNEVFSYDRAKLAQWDSTQPAATA